MKMEQEHMIIVGLLVVIAVLSYYTFKECESCKKSATEGFGLDLPTDAAAHIRMREGYGISPEAGDVSAAHIRMREGYGISAEAGDVSAAHIRMREGYGISAEAGDVSAAHIRNNANNSYQHSSHVTHHLRRDHRNKMMRNMMFGQ